MEKRPINLFQNQMTFSPKLTVLERYLRMARNVFLYGIFGLGILTLAVYGIFFFQQRSLNTERQALYDEVKQEVTKEAMLLALRARISSLKKIMTYQISIAPYIDTALLIAAPPKLSSFSLGDANSVRITVEARNVDDAVTVVSSVISLANDRKIKNPTLTSVNLNKDATLTLGFSYITILQ